MLASFYRNCCDLQCNDVFKGLKYVICKTPNLFGAFFLADVSCKNNYRILIKTLTLSCHFRVRVCFPSVTENRIFF